MNEERGIESAAIAREKMTGTGNGRPMDVGRMMPKKGTNNLGRDKLPWSQEIWDHIDRAVHDECQRTKIARRFIPIYGPVSPSALTVPSDTVGRDIQTFALAVDEEATTPLIELLAKFTLTPQQVEREWELMTAVTLATRAANHLSQAEDIAIFQGSLAVDQPAPGQQDQRHPLLRQNIVRARSGTAGRGLLNAADRQDQQRIQIVDVPAVLPLQWEVNTFRSVASAYARLQRGEDLDQAHYGPHALVLRTEPYADTYAPVLTNQAVMPNTLAITADRIKPLVTAGYYGTGTLPERKGILVSLGGNTMDLVVGMDATTAYLQEDTEGRYRFRVYERFALRLKDPTAVMRLQFLEFEDRQPEG